MARIRTIKPEMFQSYTIKRLSLSARWTFSGLLTHVDDDGYARDDARLIKSAVWPLEDEHTWQHVEQDVDEMLHAGLVCRYHHLGQPYLHVVNFAEHQKINRPTKSKLPPCPVHTCTHPELPTPPARPDEPSRNAHGALSEPSVSPHSARAGARAQEVEVEREREPPPLPPEPAVPDRTENRSGVGASIHADQARAILGNLEPAWLRPIGRGKSIVDLVSAVEEALDLGWPPDAIAHELTVGALPRDKIGSLGSYLKSRVPAVPYAPTAPATTPFMLEWCGECDQVTRTREKPDDGRVFPCPDCHPSTHGNPR